MASRRERADALRQFASRLHAFQDETLIGLQRLRLDLLYADMDEEDRATCSSDFENAAGVLTETLRVTFATQRVRLDVLAQALDTLGSDGWPSREPAVGRGELGFANNAPPARTQAISGGYTGETIQHRKETFEIWSFAGIDPAGIDWGADADFPQKFRAETWKGRTADDYRELMTKTPALLEQCRTSGTEDVAADLVSARDAYFGNDRIHLEIVDGRVSIANGRHRVMAAIESGQSIPVTTSRAKQNPGPDSCERNNPADLERRENTRARRLR